MAQVLSVAQAREGRLVAMKLLVHAFAGPVLALLADSIGRRPVLLLGHDFMGIEAHWQSDRIWIMDHHG